MTDTAQARASNRYESKTYRPRVVLNPDKNVERQLIEAIKSDRTSFSELVKQLLVKHYDID